MSLMARHLDKSLFDQGESTGQTNVGVLQGNCIDQKWDVEVTGVNFVTDFRRCSFFAVFFLQFF